MQVYPSDTQFAWHYKHVSLILFLQMAQFQTATFQLHKATAFHCFIQILLSIYIFKNYINPTQRNYFICEKLTKIFSSLKDQQSHLSIQKKFSFGLNELQKKQLFRNTTAYCFYYQTMRLKFCYNRIFQKLFKPMKLQILIALALVYSTMAISSICQSGFILNYQNSCIQPNYIQGCFIYQSQIRCHVCKYGFALAADGSCQISPVTNGSCCQQKSLTSSACLSCSQGLFLSNGSCVQINVWGCVQQDSNGICLTCGSEFYLKNGICAKGIQNCVQYSNSTLTICTQCSIDFTLFQNACLPNTILGCKAQTNDQCTQCYAPFQLTSNKCVVPNCNNHNDFGCTGCECGYYLTTNNTCASVEQGCIRYQRGICTDCLSQFKLKGGVCQIEGCLTLQGVVCTSCQKGYILSQSGCKMQNCIDWLNGQCLICEQGYNYVEGSCIASSQVQASTS